MPPLRQNLGSNPMPTLPQTLAASTQNLLGLVEEGFAFSKSYGQSDFLEASLRQHLLSLLQESPSVLTLDSGQPILEAAAEVSLPLAVTWWELRGPEAWDSLKEKPVVAARLLLAAAHAEGLDSPRAQAFFVDGLRRAMPVKTVDEGKSCQASKQDLAAQALVTEACWVESEWATVPWKTQALLAHQGALVLSERLEHTDLLTDMGLSPHQHVWGCQEKGFALTWSTLCNHLVSRSSPRHSFLKWLRDHGEEALLLDHRLLVKSVERVARGSGPPAEKWESIRKLLDRHPHGWGASIDTGQIFWQAGLQCLPTLIDPILSNPPPGGLEKKGPNGRGVWDAFLDHETLGVNPPRGSAKSAFRLLKQVPLETFGSTGKLWEYHAPPWSNELAAKTIEDQPGVWLGKSASAQSHSLSCVIINLVEQDWNEISTSRVLAGVNLLGQSLASNPSALKPPALALAWVLQRFLEAESDFLRSNDVSLFLGVQVPPPQLDIGAWWADLETNLKKHQALVGSSPKAVVVLKLLENAKLGEQLEQNWKPAKPSPRKPRL